MRRRSRTTLLVHELLVVLLSNQLEGDVDVRRLELFALLELTAESTTALPCPLASWKTVTAKLPFSISLRASAVASTPPITMLFGSLPACCKAMIAPIAISSLLAAPHQSWCPATSQLFMRSMASLRRQLASAFARPLSQGLGEDLFNAFGAQRSRLRGQLSHHNDDVAFALEEFGDCLTLELA